MDLTRFDLAKLALLSFAEIGLPRIPYGHKKDGRKIDIIIIMLYKVVSSFRAVKKRGINVRIKTILIVIAILCFGMAGATVDLSATANGHNVFAGFTPVVKTGEVYVKPSGEAWNAEIDGARVFDFLRNQSNDLAENIVATPEDIRAMPSATDLNSAYEKNNTGVMDDANTLQSLNANKEWNWYHRNSHPHTIAQFLSDMNRDPLLTGTTVRNTVGQRS
jgi:hypothetical protein